MNGYLLYAIHKICRNQNDSVLLDDCSVHPIVLLTRMVFLALQKPVQYYNCSVDYVPQLTFMCFCDNEWGGYDVVVL